jgi:hypothetical protein
MLSKMHLNLSIESSDRAGAEIPIKKGENVLPFLQLLIISELIIKFAQGLGDLAGVTAGVAAGVD